MDKITQIEDAFWRKRDDEVLCYKCNKPINEQQMAVFISKNRPLHFECWDEKPIRIPSEIQEAALKVSDWFKKQNITSWELFDLRSK